MKRLAILLVFAAGCFDSIVDDPCIDGYQLDHGRCVAKTTDPTSPTTPPPTPTPTPTDDPKSVPPDVTIEPPVCSMDLQTDALNCGACGHACESGICETGHCLGALSGHIVAIGHDYQQHNAAMARVLGNAVSLGAHHDVAVARWYGSASDAAIQGTNAALAQGMTANGRPWHEVALPAMPADEALAAIDVLLVDAQTIEIDAAPWATAIDHLLQHGGVVVVLEGVGGKSYRFAETAGLAMLQAPVDATGLPATVANSSDALTQHVVSPYLATTTSVAFAGATGSIATQAGPLVVHETRY